MYVVRYSAVDGYRKTKRFKTLAGARKYAVDRVGEDAEFGSYYAVSSDGVGKVVVDGCSLAELFGRKDERLNQENWCPACTAFFARYSCGKLRGSGECDCPRCQGYCECPT